MTDAQKTDQASVAQQAADASVGQPAAQLYQYFKTGKKIRTYGKLVEEAVDEETRTGGLMKLAIRAALEVVGKALGTSLTSHPYFAIHKVHLEVLAQALNASSNQDDAREALNRAIRAADASASLAKVLDDYQSRKNGLKLSYNFKIRGPLLQLRDSATSAQAAAQIKASGSTPESLQALTDKNIYEWRASWCELYAESLQLLGMAQVELRTTETMMQRFELKMRTLSSPGRMPLFGVAASRIEDQKKLDYVSRSSQEIWGKAANISGAVADPVGYARRQVEAIERVTDVLGEGCEAAMSDDAYQPDRIFARMGSL